MTDMDKESLAVSAVTIERNRFIKTPLADMLFKVSAKAAGDIFSSLTDIQGIMEAELIYMENESDFCHSKLKKMFTNTITAYHKCAGDFTDHHGRT